MPGGFEFRGKRLVQKHQIFLSSTVFHPSRGLLEAGGVVDVYALGGGGSGLVYSSYGGGGNAGQTIEDRVVVTGPTVVVIGAGGAAVTSGAGNSGGDSSFGSVVASGGARLTASGPNGSGEVGKGGAGSGGHAPTMSGSSTYARATSGFSAGTVYSDNANISHVGGPPNRRGHGRGGNALEYASPTPRANCGDGGYGATSGTSTAGSSGRVELTWWEYEQ